MKAFKDELLQAVLDQSPSIDEAARVLCEAKNNSDFSHWRNRIIKKLEAGELTMENMK